MVLALLAVLAAPMAALASNVGDQEASTASAETILIVSKAGTANVTVSTITFPEGLPGATISNPSNNQDGTAAGDINTGPQVLSGTVSEPVVQLYNGSAGTLTVTLEITTWTNSVVVAEYYELVATDNLTVNAVDDVLSSNGAANSADTGITIDTLTYKALYLEVDLSSIVANQAGESTLSILGQS